MCEYRRWNEAKLFKFLRLYKGHECLWNPYSSEYDNRVAKSEALSEILYEMKTVGLTINECFSQIKYLRESYKLEREKLESIELLGGRGYSNLLWYQLMRGMLFKVVKDEEKLSQEETGGNDRSKSFKSSIAESGDNEKNSMRHGDYWTDFNFTEHYNEASNEHIGSCPTCGYSIKVGNNRDDDQSQIVNYNKPSLAVRISSSQKCESPRYNNCLSKSWNILSEEPRSNLCNYLSYKRITNNREKIAESIFKDIRKDIRAEDDRNNIDDNLDDKEIDEKIVKPVDKKICWREPVEENFHVDSPCKSVRSTSIDQINLDGGILTIRNKSPCFRLIAGSDSGFDDETRRFDLFRNRKKSKSRNRKNCLTYGDEGKKNCQQDDLTSNYDNECPIDKTNDESCEVKEMIENDLMTDSRFRDKELMDEGMEMVERNLNGIKKEEDDGSDLLDDDDRSSMTEDCKLSNVTIRNILVETVDENLEAKKDNQVLVEVANRAIEIVEKNLFENGYGIKKDWECLMRRSLIADDDMNGRENEGTWKIELKKIVADLMRTNRNGEPIVLKLKTTILPPAVRISEENNNRGCFFENGITRSDEDCGNGEMRSSDNESKEEGNGSSIEMRNTSFEKMESVTRICKEKSEGPIDLDDGLRETTREIKSGKKLMTNSKMKNENRKNDLVAIGNGVKNGFRNRRKANIKVFLCTRLSREDESLLVKRYRRRISVSSIRSRGENLKRKKKKIIFGRDSGLEDSMNFNNEMRNDYESYFIKDNRVLEENRLILNAKSNREELFLNGEKLINKIDEISKSIKILSAGDNERREFVRDNIEEILSRNNVNSLNCETDFLNPDTTFDEEINSSRDKADKSLQTFDNEEAESSLEIRLKIAVISNHISKSYWDRITNGIIGSWLCGGFFDVRSRIRSCKTRKESDEISGADNREFDSKNGVTGNAYAKLLESKNCQTESSQKNLSESKSGGMRNDSGFETNEHNYYEYNSCCKESRKEVDIDEFVVAVASVLRGLSKEAALRSQQRIQTLISNTRLEYEKMKKRR